MITTDVVVIGAGAAGIAMGHELTRCGISFLIVEAEDVAGGLWSQGTGASRAFPGLNTVTSSEVTQFSNHPFPPDSAVFPRQADVARYLLRQLEQWTLQDHVLFGRRVKAVLPTDNDLRVIVDAGDQIRCRTVVLATGMQRVAKPAPSSLQNVYGNRVIHSAQYANVNLGAGSQAIVVGGGNSAASIVSDLITKNCEVHWVLPSQGRWFLPRHVRGITTPRWDPAQNLNAFEFQTALAHSLKDEWVGPLEQYGLRTPQHLPFEFTPIIGTRLLEEILDGRITASHGMGRNGIGQADKPAKFTEPDVVICATGYSESISDLLPDVPIFAAGLSLRCVVKSDPRIALIGDLPSDLGGFWTLELIAAVIAEHLGRLIQTGVPASWVLEEPQTDFSGGGRFASRPGGLSPFFYGPVWLGAMRSAARMSRVDLTHLDGGLDWIMLSPLRRDKSACLRAAARLMAAPGAGQDHDLWSIYREPHVLHDLVELLHLPFANSGITHVVGPESRGFVLGGMIAYRLGVAFVPARKSGRYLPGEIQSTQSQPDWHDNRVVFEMQTHSLGHGDRILIVDDWFTTGNQARAIIELVTTLGAEVIGASVLVDEGCDRLEETGIRVSSLLSWSDQAGCFRQSKRARSLLRGQITVSPLERI